MVRALPRGFSVLAATLVAIFTGACDADLPAGESAPSASLYFPAAVFSTQNQSGGAFAHVVNANFDQRFNSGWITTLDLTALMQAADPAAVALPEVTRQQLNIPSLAHRVALGPGATPQYLLVAQRGSAALTVVEIRDGVTLFCGDTASDAGLSTEESRTDCDRQHLMALDSAALHAGMRSDDIADPAALGLVERDGAAYVALGYLGSGWLSFFRVQQQGNVPMLAPVSSLSLSLSSMAGLSFLPTRSQDQGGFLVAAVGSLTSSGVNYSTMITVDAERVFNTPQLGAPSQRVQRFYDDVGGAQMQEILFAPAGDYAFAANRAPNAVVLFAVRRQLIAAGQTGQISFEPLDAAPLAGRPVALAYVQRSGRDDMVAAVDVEGDSVYFFKVLGNHRLLQVARLDQLAPDGTFPVGAGPVALAQARAGGRDLLLVTTFYDHGLAVIDISSVDPQAFRSIAYLRSPNIQPTARM